MTGHPQNSYLKPMIQIRDKKSERSLSRLRKVLLRSKKKKEKEKKEHMLRDGNQDARLCKHSVKPWSH